MKKKITCLILAIALMFGFADAVIAGGITWVSVDATGNGTVLGGSTLTRQEECMFGGYNGLSLNAVRLTIVDRSGNRVAGTRTVDFTSGGSGSGSKYRSMDGKTRNEIISGGMSYGYGSDTVRLEPWANLPLFNCTGNDCGGSVLKNYFLTKYKTSDTADLIRIFEMMGYEGYKNPLIYENHLLLVEPIFQTRIMIPNRVHKVTNGDVYYEQSYYEEQVQYRSKAMTLAEAKRVVGNDLGGEKNNGNGVPELDCENRYETYYGTATEILYMLEHEPSELKNYDMRNYVAEVKKNYGNSYGTIVSNIATLVYDDADAGNLWNASGIVNNKSEVRRQSISRYGLGSMHVWMKYILNGNRYCPNSDVTVPDNVPDDQVDAWIAQNCNFCVDKDGVQHHWTQGMSEAEIEAFKKQECGISTDPVPCNYDLKTKITNDCTAGQEGYIKDIGEDENGNTNLNEWACIFKAANAPRDTYEAEFYHPNDSEFFDNNPYCRVACRETVKYRLPSTFEEVAGRRFTIGISNDFTTGVTPNTIEGTTTCSTAYYPGTETPFINYELFKQQYANANIAVEAAWDAYQIELAKEKSANDIISEYQSGSGEHNCKEDLMCQDRTENPHWAACMSIPAAIMAQYGRSYSECGDQYTITDRHCERSKGECSNGPFEHDGQSGWTQTTHVGRVYSYKGQNYQITYVTSSDGHHGDNKPNFNTAALKAAYDDAVEYRRTLLKLLNNCNNFQRTYSEFEPTLSFAYSESRYKGFYKLAATSQTNAITNYLVNNQSVSIKEWTTAGYEGSSDTFKTDMLNSYGSIAYIDRTDCGAELQPCVNNEGAQAFPNNTSVIQTTRKTYEYELSSNIYRYVGKNGVAYNTITEAESSGYPYIDTGRSNLPINYDTQSGWYHYYYDFYYADNNVNLFGTNQKFLKYNKIEPGGSSNYNGLTLANNLLYHCIYKINCGLTECPPPDPVCPDGSPMPDDGKCPDYEIVHKICPDGTPMPISGRCPAKKGLNVIYRTISLRDPFPGEHGEGRSSGANWDGQTTVLGTKKSFIDAYITNNRGVDTEDVYSERPMYQFTLTAANMRAIRKYNKSVGNNYTDFKLECENGKYCKSDFLESGFANNYFGFTTENSGGGTCFDANATNWESCRYSNIGG